MDFLGKYNEQSVLIDNESRLSFFIVHNYNTIEYR